MKLSCIEIEKPTFLNIKVYILILGISPFFLFSEQSRADNNVFLTLLEKYIGNHQIYNCSVTIKTETTDAFCQKNCKKKLFLFIQEEEKQPVVLVDTYNNNYVAKKHEYINKKNTSYIYNRNSLYRTPKIRAKIVTDNKKRIASLHLQKVYEDGRNFESARCDGSIQRITTIQKIR